jgi:hypothetical protein
MPRGGPGPLPFPVSPWLPLSPSASSSSRRGLIAAGCGCGCSIALAPPQRAAGWCCAARPCGGRGSCRQPQVRGRCGGRERAAKAHQATQVWGRGAVGRCCADRAAGPPITGAGLDPSCTPDGIPSNGSDGEGCWGGEAAGTDANVGVDVVRVVAVPEGGAAVVRFVEPGAAAQQLGDPPSTLTLEVMSGPDPRRSRGAKTGGGAAEPCGHGPGGHSSSGRRRGPGHRGDDGAADPGRSGAGPGECAAGCGCASGCARR